MSHALSRFNIPDPRLTPQSCAIPGRESEMAPNDAGGYAFVKDTWDALLDFLVLGTEGGTYYVGEREHTYRNVRAVVAALDENGVSAVDLAVQVSTARPARAPKNYPALFVVASALAHPDLAVRQAAADAVPLVARTTDHMAHLFGYFKQIKGASGGGRVVRRAWASWLATDDPDTVAYRVLKSRQRKTGSGEDFRPADLLRLATPAPDSPARQALYAMIMGAISPMVASGHLSAAKAFYEAQKADTPATAVRAIRAYHVPWEFLPDQVLDSPAVWEALIPHLGLTALIRNLARMTRLGALGPFRPANAWVYDRLTDQAALHRARIHPFDLLLAHRAYASGRSQPHHRSPLQTWAPVPEVLSALGDAYRLSFSHFEKVDRRLLIAVDCSGSMGQPVVHGGSNLGSAYHVCSALAQAIYGTVTQPWLMEFNTDVRPTRVRDDMSIDQVFGLTLNGGGTDLSAPIRWALDNNVHVDGFLILSDQETWHGYGHPTEHLERYRRRVNPAARVIVAATTASGRSVVDPRDPGVLNVAGFDSSLPALVGGFLRRSGSVTSGAGGVW